jgi:thiol-disulfide isomerase/thioredoxin
MGVIKNQVSLDSSDAQVDLTHVPGQVILLHFWSTLCPPCQVSMHTNQEMLSRKGAEWLSKVRIIGISIDEGKDKIKSFLQEKQWDQMEHYWSPNGVFVANKLYEERDLPRALLVDTNGKIVFEGDPATRNLEQDINDLL